MDVTWKSILSSHFLWGLIIGLLIWLFTVIKSYFSHRNIRKAKDGTINHLKNEKNKLKQHLQIQLEIESESKERQKQTLEKLREENENLRTSVQTLRLKPRREEIILLQIYDRAIHIMQERAPGFAPTWEGTLKEAKTEIDKANRGVIPFIRRVIHPSSTPLIVTDNRKRLESSEN
jgi:hypothetical protein